MTVYSVAARFKSGETAEEILDGYPDLTPEHVRAAVRYAESHPLVEQPDARPWRSRPSKKVVA
jgi:uncharacterized protein (DUF433 family)